MDQVASSLPARQAWCPTLICHRRPGFHLSLWGGLGQLAWASLADPGVPPRRLSGSVEIKLGKNRTEAEVKRYTEEKERLEKKKEEIRGHLAQLRKEKRELKETLLKCTGNGVPRRGAWALSGGGQNPDQRTWSTALSAFGTGGCSLQSPPLHPVSKAAVLPQDMLEKLVQGGTLKLNLCV